MLNNEEQADKNTTKHPTNQLTMQKGPSGVADPGFPRRGRATT